MRQFTVVFQAELMRRLRSRVFIAGLIFGGLTIALVSRLPALMTAVESNLTHHVALSGPTTLTVPAQRLLSRTDLAVRVVPEQRLPPTPATLRALNVGSLLELSTEHRELRVTIYAEDPTNVEISTIRSALLPLDLALGTGGEPERFASELRFPVAVQSVSARFKTVASSLAAHAIAYLLLILLYMLIVFSSQLVLTSVAEEKTSRIAELLVTSVDLTTLLSAKIVVSTTLAVLQMVTWIVLAFALSGTGPSVGVGSASGAGSGGTMGLISFSGLPPSTIVGFLAFFVLGFMQMAVLFAGLASLVNRTEDLGAMSGPLFLPVIVAFIAAVVTLSSPDAPFAVACSFIPVLSPFVMFARLAVSTVPASQVAGAGIIDVLCVVLFSLAGGRLYRVGMLLYGSAPSWSQIFRTMVGNLPV